MSWQLRFLGVGAAHAVELGASAAVLERDGKPELLIDCGPNITDIYTSIYGEPPRTLYITHVHMDHVADLERLFFRIWFDPAWRGQVRLYVAAPLLPWLHARVGDYPRVVAEGGVNFWEAFRLIPASRGFWLDEQWLEIFPTRHHRLHTSFGLALPGSLVYTGDTRPIPEVLTLHAARGELIAHDCGLISNPSHSGVDDLEREYPAAWRERLLLYHYGSKADGQALQARGFRIAQAGQNYPLPAPVPVDELMG